MLLQKKNAVITGCNKGIGKKLVEVFSENGANIIACVRTPDKDFIDFTKKIQKKNNNQVDIIKLDLSNKEEVKSAANEIISKTNSIDILVNNAAIIHTALFQMTSENKLREIFDVDFFSQTIFTQHILKSMMKNKKGSIIYISSSSAIDGNRGRSAYSAAKAALLSQAKTLSKEVGEFNIRVNGIAPGLTNTDMMIENTEKKIIDDVISQISLRRVATPKEIANAALFLSSDLASYITGQFLRVDGGM
jgi:3-oxoacyl-[acyl-carrier protein] reductase